MFKNILHYIF